MSNSFEVEGIEIRIQQKILSEFVKQSNDITVDYSVNPRIYLGVDGLMYFYDESIETPIVLSKIEQFYNRIRLVDGELRFYEKDLLNYADLSFFVNAKSNTYDKPNSLIENKNYDVFRDTTFNSSAILIDFLNKNIRETKTDEPEELVQTFFDTVKDILAYGLIDNEPVAYFLIKHFLVGLGSDGRSPSSYLTIARDDYFLNKIAIGLKNLTVKKFLGLTFDDMIKEFRKISFTYDGVGKTLYGIMRLSEFGVIVPSSSIILDDYNYRDGNNALRSIKTSTNNSIEIDSRQNSSCINSTETSEILNILTTSKAGFKFKSGILTGLSGTGIYNKPITVSEGCDGAESTVSLINSSHGVISYDEETLFDIDTSNISIWFHDFDKNDNSGVGVIDYVTTPINKKISRNIEIRARIETDWTTEHQLFLDQNIELLPESTTIVDIINGGYAVEWSGNVITGDTENIFNGLVDYVSTSWAEYSMQDPIVFGYNFSEVKYISEYRFYFADAASVATSWSLEVKNGDVWSTVDIRNNETPPSAVWTSYYQLTTPVRAEELRINILGSSGESLTVKISGLEARGYNAGETDIVSSEDINLVFPDIIDISGNTLYSFQTETYGLSGNAFSVISGGPSIERFFSRRKMLGVFSEGIITFNINNGFIRPNLDLDTQYNKAQVYENDLFFEPLRFGYIKTTLGDIKFDSETTFTIEKDTLVEIWYEDFDSTDNEGSVSIRYNYTPIDFGLNSTVEEVSLLPKNINSDYLFDQMTKRISDKLWDIFYASFKDQLNANGIINEDGLFLENFDDNVEDILISTNNRILTLIYSASLNLIDSIEFFNTFSSLYLKHDLTRLNTEWFDLPNFVAVVPKSPPNYAATILSNFTIDYIPGIPCNIEFRLYDSTAEKELDRMVVSYPNSRPYTKDLGDITKPRIDTLHVQLAYFGPLSKISCSKEVYAQKEKETSDDVKSHIILHSNEILTDDVVNEDKFGVIADRIRADLSEQTIDSNEVVNLEAPRVIRVQWKMTFGETDDSIIESALGRLEFDSIASIERPKSRPIINKKGQLTFEPIIYDNNSQAESNISINLYSFGNYNSSGKTLQGTINSKGDRKRFTVSDPRLNTFKDNQYSIILSCSKNINLWYDNKTSLSFDVLAEKEFSGEISWIAIKGKGSDSEYIRDQNSKLVYDCVIDNKPKNSELSDYEILIDQGYLFEDTTEEQLKIIEKNILGDFSGVAKFVDPNGPSCSQTCIDDCPEGFTCSSDCYTASLTESGCGCCQCLDDNDCVSGFVCNDLNECIEI